MFALYRKMKDPFTGETTKKYVLWSKDWVPTHFCDHIEDALPVSEEQIKLITSKYTKDILYTEEIPDDLAFAFDEDKLDQNDQINVYTDEMEQ